MTADSAEKALILHSHDPSPFGRLVKLTAHVVGLMDRIDVRSTPTSDPDGLLAAVNPLGKIPVLLTPEGTALYDSRVICEYLDDLATITGAREAQNAGLPLFPLGQERWPALTLLATATGLMDAAILIVYERRFRDEAKVHEPWIDMQQTKVNRALDLLANAEGPLRPPGVDPVLTIGHLGVACALGYLDIRQDGRWRNSHPGLANWLAAFAETVPAFDATAPKL